jgi:hypothetical protein
VTVQKGGGGLENGVSIYDGNIVCGIDYAGRRNAARNVIEHCPRDFREILDYLGLTDSLKLEVVKDE